MKVLSETQAMTKLHISRPTLKKLVDEGVIRKAGTKIILPEEIDMDTINKRFDKIEVMISEISKHFS